MKKVGKIGVALLAASAAIFLFSSRASAAAPSHLLINEICPKPESGNAWVELYNPTEIDLYLADYSIEDNTHKPKDLPGLYLPAGGYFVFEKDPFSGFGFVLNTSSAEIVILKKNGSVVDQISYGRWEDPVYDSNPDDNPQIPGLGKSLSRIPNGTDSDNDKEDFKLTPPSINSVNLIPEYSSSILINEILPEPLNGFEVEYIELSNFSEQPVNLSGWQLDDAEGGSPPYAIPNGAIIEAGGYLTFSHSETGISLNDSGDMARLIDPNGDVRDQLTYGPAKKGLSYAKFGDEWLWTTSVTPAEDNINTPMVMIEDDDSSPVEMNIFDAKKLPLDSTLVISGIVSVLPGVLSSQYFYIQDNSAGIQIYGYRGEFPILSLGDQVRVSGETASYHGEGRVRVSQLSDIAIIGKGEQPRPEMLAPEEIVEDDVGRYVSTAGAVLSTSGSIFILSGSSQLKVVIRESAGVKKPRLKKGDRVSVVGIVSSYDGALRILPIYESGVMILTSGRLPVTGGDLWETQWNISVKTQSKRPNSSQRSSRDYLEVICYVLAESWVAAKPQA